MADLKVKARYYYTPTLNDCMRLLSGHNVHSFVCKHSMAILSINDKHNYMIATFYSWGRFGIVFGQRRRSNVYAVENKHDCHQMWWLAWKKLAQAIVFNAFGMATEAKWFYRPTDHKTRPTLLLLWLNAFIVKSRPQIDDTQWNRLMNNI